MQLRSPPSCTRVLLVRGGQVWVAGNPSSCPMAPSMDDGPMPTGGQNKEPILSEYITYLLIMDSTDNTTCLAY